MDLRTVISNCLQAAVLIVAFMTTTTTLAFHWPILCLAALQGIAFGVLGGPRVKSLPSRHLLCAVVFFLFVSYCFLRECFSPVWELARQDMAMLFLASIVYISAHTSARRLFLPLLIVAALGNVALAVYQTNLGAEASIYSWMGYDRTGHLDRPSGFFFNANHFAAFLLAALAVILANVLFAEWSVSKRLCGGFVVIMCIAGILLSKSRGGIAATFLAVLLFVGVALIMLVRIRGVRWSVTIVLFGVVIVMGVFGIVGWKAVHERQQLAKDRDFGEAIEIDPRWALWESGVKQWYASPWVGNGAGSYEYQELKFRPVVPGNEDRARGVYTHNDLLQLLSEYGSVGLGLFGIMVLTHCIILVRSVMSRLDRMNTGWLCDSDAALSLGAAIAFIALLAHAFVEFHVRVPVILCCGSLFLGLMAIDLNGNKLVRHNRVSQVFGMRLAAVVCGAGLLFGAFWYGPVDTASHVASRRLEDGDVLGALKAVQWGVKRDVKSPTALAMQGKCSVVLGNRSANEVVKQSFFRKAITSYEAALEHYPQSVEYLLVLTRLHARIGNTDRGLRYWESAYEWAPLWYATHRARVDALVFGNRIEDAIAACREWYALTNDWRALPHQKKLEDSLAGKAK